MYFASDIPGGYGGPDLYMTTLDSGKWSQPINLGDEINTSGDELFPSIKNDSILYFSSSGLGGFGGLDLFVSTLNNWTPSKPTNMSSPLNSEADDFAIMVDSTGRNGYFSSNRTGGKGYDDIYSFETILFAGVGKVISRQDQSAIPEASVIISMKEGSPVTQLKSDSLGIVKLSLPYDQDFLLSAGKDGYSDLYKVPYSTIDNRISFDTLLMPLWRDELFAQGRIFSNETQELIPDATIVLINKDNGLRDSVVTNEDGTYYFPLAPDSRYHLRVLHDGFIENGLDINTDKIYEGNLLNDMLLEEVYVDKMIVYFDFDAADLNSGYNDELKKLLRTLEKYPKSIINIAAHADARGEETYNKNLSNDRLKAVTTYFRRNGIKNKRIHGTAFGEELLLNQCSDGVVCEEEDHSKNRRAEIKVQLNAIH
jgi:outer membrane protein OmpA-like peptidoglycan-associated protein